MNFMKRRESMWWLIKIPLSENGHSSRIKMLLSRNFRELHVYLSRGPCWATRKKNFREGSQHNMNGLAIKTLYKDL